MLYRISQGRAMPTTMEATNMPRQRIAFRDHPLILYRGMRTWPPCWIEYKTKRKRLGEVGTLTDVRFEDTMPTRLFLTIRHQDTTWLGALLFTDQDAARVVKNILRTKIGWTCREIGDWDMGEIQ